MKCMRKLAIGCLAAIASTGHAAPVDLITNGTFSGGLSGWVVADRNDVPGTSGSFFAVARGDLTPVNGFLTAGNATAGGFFAVSDSSGPGAHALYQSFTTLSAGSRYTLRFDLVADDQSGFGGPGSSLVGEQYARVDLLRPGALPFSTSPADIIATFYNNVDAGVPPNPFQSYSFDITSFVLPGLSYLIRFAEVDSNGAPVNLGIDNVSLVVPSPDTVWLLSLGLVTVAAGSRMRRKRA